MALLTPTYHDTATVENKENLASQIERSLVAYLDQAHAKLQGRKLASLFEATPLAVSASAGDDFTYQIGGALLNYVDDALAQWQRQQSLVFRDRPWHVTNPAPSELPPCRLACEAQMMTTPTQFNPQQPAAGAGISGRKVPPLVPEPMAAKCRQSWTTPLAVPSIGHPLGIGAEAEAPTHGYRERDELARRPGEPAPGQATPSIAPPPGLPVPLEKMVAAALLPTAAVQAPARRDVPASVGSLEQSPLAADQPAATAAVAIVTREQLPRDGGWFQRPRWWCNFVFRIPAKKAEVFQLVPRLIGKGGRNMKPIAEACNGKIRIRGRGSGYAEGPSRKEANIPLQLALSCENAEDYALGRRLLGEVLEQMEARFVEHCRKMQMDPPARFYMVQEGGRSPRHHTA